ncbi:hypothetical protein [Lysobacter sp. GCM10012299]|uniref:hypothetical protein n=1 Tax=Lysobacter sp. GCM10012299 TaxID=3317333 RepID=UPI003612DA8B
MTMLQEIPLAADQWTRVDVTAGMTAGNNYALQARIQGNTLFYVGAVPDDEDARVVLVLERFEVAYTGEPLWFWTRYATTLATEDLGVTSTAGGPGSSTADLSLEATQQQVLQALQAALLPVRLRIPATDGMTDATVSGVAMPASWNLHINGQLLALDVDYSYAGDGSAATPLIITFLPALGFPIEASDLIVITS